MLDTVYIIARRLSDVKQRNRSIADYDVTIWCTSFAIYCKHTSIKNRYSVYVNLTLRLDFLLLTIRTVPYDANAAHIICEKRLKHVLTYNGHNEKVLITRVWRETIRTLFAKKHVTFICLVLFSELCYHRNTATVMWNKIL